MRLFILLVLLYPFSAAAQNIYTYTNLALEGGGIRGLAYSGALKVLEEKGISKNIVRVAGTSSGAVIGLMISLGYNSNEIDSVFQSLEIQRFNDGKNIFSILQRLKKEYGIYRGDRFEKWISRLIQNKTGTLNTTFLELHQLHQINVDVKDFVLYPNQCNQTTASNFFMAANSFDAIKNCCPH